MKLLIFYNIFFITLFSCVGKIEDKNPKVVSNAKEAGESVLFDGVVEAKPISHDKAEVLFYPASGNQSNLIYQVYLNGSKTPIEVRAESLYTSPEGLYVYTLRDLRVDQTYSVAVGVKNLTDNSESNNNRSLVFKTFINKTATFEGALNAYPAQGDAGRNAIVVEWFPAKILGFSSLLNAYDPVSYEIRYIKGPASNIRKLESLASGDVKVVNIGNPQDQNLVEDRMTTISGLDSNTQYFFIVRAIHKEYVSNDQNESYRREENFKVVAAQTRNGEGVFEWDITSLNILTPRGGTGKSAIDMNWSGAKGSFVGYRIYRKELTDPNSEKLTEAEIDNLNSLGSNSGNNFVEINPSEFSRRINDLNSYRYYDIRMAACKTLACGEGERFLSPNYIKRIVPKLAPFEGINLIQNPKDLNALNKFEIIFDAPMITEGYLTGYELTCHDGESGNGQVLTIGGSPNNNFQGNCAKLKIITSSYPSSLNGFKTFTKLDVEYVPTSMGDDLAGQTVCFSLKQEINEQGYLEKGQGAVVKCQKIKIETPTIKQFLGLNAYCETGDGKFKVSWNPPTGGLYRNYELFFKEEDSNAFSFADAIATNYTAIESGFPVDVGDSSGVKYYRVEGISGSANNTDVDDTTLVDRLKVFIKPGKKFQVGILSYAVANGSSTKNYSDFNAQVIKCNIAYPLAKFEEWVDVMAIGPKVDGRYSANDKDLYIPETIAMGGGNPYGQPLEVGLNQSNAPGAEFVSAYSSLNLSSTFDGVYGVIDGNTSGSGFQYSNRGIIHLAWKDITFPENTVNTNLNTIKDIENDSSVSKKDRKVGYKVYRSHDDGQSWVELTVASSDNNQTSSNSGLIHPKSYLDPDRVISGTTISGEINVAQFTDYSVLSIDEYNGVARAREYLYKIIPIYNGVPLQFISSQENNPQHIIKVILPPANMALINRLMANRQTCKEIGALHNKDVNSFYNCSYNGLGAQVDEAGNSVYDFMGDLLIDRFEMGCDISRGDSNYSNSKSKKSDGSSNLNFGHNGADTDFVGCYMNSSFSNKTIIVNNTAVSQPNDYALNLLRLGDCIGLSQRSIYSGAGTCSVNSSLYNLVYPGLNSYELACSESSYNFNDLVDPYGELLYTHALQSEYLGVYYNRFTSESGEDIHIKTMRGGADATSKIEYKSYRYPSSCSINIPVSNDSSTDSTGGEGRIKPRWIPVNQLDLLTLNNGSNLVDIDDLTTKTVTEIEAMDNDILFSQNSGSINHLPLSSYRNITQRKNTRNYDNAKNIKLARLFSSNDSKLPPLTRLNQDQAMAVCGSYEVEVKVKPDNASNIGMISRGDKYKKRLMRRTEGLIASAHPKMLTGNTIEDVEKGKKINNSSIVENGSCNAKFRHDNTEGLGSKFNGQELMNAAEKYSTQLSSVYDTNAKENTVLITGSSYLDDGNHSQNCISRYGVQDIIGNISEVSSERFFCNFSGEKMFVTAATESVADSFEIAGGGSEYYDANNITPWTESAPSTGQCSFHQKAPGPTVAFTDPSNFIYKVGATLVPLRDFSQNINTNLFLNLIENDIPDVNSLDFLRDARTGRILDFGQQGFAGPISHNDTLAIHNLDDSSNFTGTGYSYRGSKASGDPRASSLFNPIIGIPLFCNKSGSPCDDGGDNVKITTSSIANSNAIIQNFFTGNSEIFTTGISESDSGIQYDSSVNSFGPINHISGIETSSDPNTAIMASLDSGTPGLQIGNSYWSFSRDGIGYFENFGNVDTHGSGRYGAFLKGRNSINQKSADKVGFRCAVKLGE